jgi:hypothetical protein
MSTLKIDRSDRLRVHAGRANLLIHPLAVPPFVVSAVSIPTCLFAGDPVSATTAAVMFIITLALQGDSLPFRCSFCPDDGGDDSSNAVIIRYEC